MNLKRLSRLLAIIAVTLLGLGLRLDAVSRLPIDYDEDDYLRAAQQYSVGLQHSDASVFLNENYRSEHPPLTKIINGLVIAGLPPAREIPDRPTTASPAAALPKPHLTYARTAEAVFGSLAVLALAILNPLAGLFLAVSTWTIKYTSQVMLEALPALTSLLLVIFYLKSKGKSNRWLVLSAIMLGLTASSKYNYGIIALAVAVHWLWSTFPGRSDQSAPSIRKWLQPIIVWGAIALIVFFATDPYLWPDPINRLSASIAYHGDYAQSQAVQDANLPIWQPFVYLFQSVPYHPGLFQIMIDFPITLLALLGLRRFWQKQRVFALWLIVALAFLLVWPTKWPQYILTITAAVALAGAEGFAGSIWEPLIEWWRHLRSIKWRRPDRGRVRATWREVRQAAPWLLPGLIAIALITLYPLIYQAGMSLTDVNTLSLRDTLQHNGVWRAVGEGLSGQVKPVAMTLFDSPRSNLVNYAGPGIFLQFLSGAGADLLVFELIWTVLSVGLQSALGISVALLLYRRGVRWRGWWRALFILPWAIPEFVGALIWFQIFEPTNGWVSLYSGTPFNWQDSPGVALLVMLVAGIWIGWPLMMLAASAGLKSIPIDVNDAAAMDGASGWSRFRSITWPLLLPLLAPVFIIRIIFAFNQFYLFYVMQAPYPIMTLSTASFYFFDATSGFGGQFAISAAINLFTVLVLLVLIVWFTRRSHTAEGVTYA